MNIERVATDRVGLGEGAVWDDRGEALYFLDIFGQKVIRHDPVTGDSQSWRTSGHVGAMALSGSGAAVLAIGDTLVGFDFASGAEHKLAGPVFDNPRVVVNDGAADHAGRFVFGGCCAGMDDPQPIGGLFSLDRDRRVVQLDDGVHQSNSHCFSADGRTLYCSDSFTCSTYAYDYDLASGEVAGKRLFATTHDLGGKPDGSAVDRDGLVWMAIFEGAKIVAFRPDGRLERTIDLPARLPSSVAWGGANLDVLYVTTIDPQQFGWAEEPAGGYLYAITGLGAQGAPEGRYAG